MIERTINGIKINLKVEKKYFWVGYGTEKIEIKWRKVVGYGLSSGCFSWKKRISFSSFSGKVLEVYFKERGESGLFGKRMSELVGYGIKVEKVEGGYKVIIPVV